MSFRIHVHTVHRTVHATLDTLCRVHCTMCTVNTLPRTAINGLFALCVVGFSITAKFTTIEYKRRSRITSI